VDRKLIAWLLICVSLFLLFNSMQRNREIARLEQEKQAKVAEDLKQKKLQDTKAQAEAIAKQDPTFSLPVEPERVRTTLGSMDPQDSFPFLVTLDNQGAAIERIELVGQTKKGSFDYRSLPWRNARAPWMLILYRKGPLRPPHCAKKILPLLVCCPVTKLLGGINWMDRHRYTSSKKG
jgi:hypothetical protein